MIASNRIRVTKIVKTEVLGQMSVSHGEDHSVVRFSQSEYARAIVEMYHSLYGKKPAPRRYPGTWGAKIFRFFFKYGNFTRPQVSKRKHEQQKVLLDVGEVSARNQFLISS